MDGIGPKKAIQVRYRLGISGNIKREEYTKYQIDQIEQMIGQDHVVHWELKRGERADIERLISISCYRGIRHQDGSPLRDAVNELILMLGLVASEFGNERRVLNAILVLVQEDTFLGIQYASQGMNMSAHKQEVYTRMA